MLHARLGYGAWIPVCPIQIRKVAGDTLLQLLHPRLELMLREVPVPTVHRLELAAVDRHQRITEQVQAPAEHHKLPAHALDGRSVVLAEIRNGLEVWRQPS